jgi:ubiquinone/menaquinone biosynthesis C-methylase UbiE
MVQGNISTASRFDEDGSPGFDRMAHHYDKSRGEYPTEYLLKGLRQTLGHDLSELKGKKILDAGAGTGQISAALLSTGAIVTGVDISPSMLAIAKERCAQYPDFTPLEGDLRKLPFPDNSFDMVTSRWVLEFVPGWTKAIRELRRVLKPEGTMVLIFTNNMLRTTPRTLFEQIARKRGLRIGLPGATNRLLSSYLAYEGADVVQVSPEELHWARELPVERTLWEFRSRLLNHLYEISDEEYNSVLDEVEKIIAERYPQGLVDRPTVVTTFWKINFKRQPNPVLGLRFKAVRTASRLNRTLPRLYRRAVTKTLGR